MRHRLAPLAAAVATTAALALAAIPATAAERGEAKVTLGGKKVVIEYGRPTLQGRDMLGRLPEGQTWRMGADADTTLKTDAELTFGTVVVPKGEYVLTAKRSGVGKWTLIAGGGGKEIEVPLAETKLPASVELFTIELSGKGNAGQLVTKWQTLQLSAPFTAK